MVWMQIVVTKSNALLQLKEVGPHGEDTSRCIDLECANDAPAFYTQKSCDCTCSDITSDVTVEIHDATSHLERCH